MSDSQTPSKRSHEQGTISLLFSRFRNLSMQYGQRKNEIVVGRQKNKKLDGILTQLDIDIEKAKKDILIKMSIDADLRDIQNILENEKNSLSQRDSEASSLKRKIEAQSDLRLKDLDQVRMGNQAKLNQNILLNRKIKKLTTKATLKKEKMQLVIETLKELNVQPDPEVLNKKKEEISKQVEVLSTLRNEELSKLDEVKSKKRDMHQLMIEKKAETENLAEKIQFLKKEIKNKNQKLINQRNVNQTMEEEIDNLFESQNSEQEALSRKTMLRYQISEAMKLICENNLQPDSFAESPFEMKRSSQAQFDDMFRKLNDLMDEAKDHSEPGSDLLNNFNKIEDKVKKMAARQNPKA